MAFPIIPLVTALLSDGQSRQQEQQAIQEAGNANLQKILRMRASELGGSPYTTMGMDNANQLGDIRRQAEASRNNNIGNLLQAYLKQPSAPEPQQELMGDDYADSFLEQPNLQYNAVEDGIGIGDAMGKSQVDLWDKDPWGDAGF